jgi:hypothetical protein
VARVRVRAVAGALLCVTGVIWIAQGTNLLHGSGMSGHGEWTTIGLFVLVLGGALLLSVRAGRARRDS